MATVNFRIDEALKEKSYSILKEQGIAPTDFFTSMRINDPKEMFEEVTLDDL